MIKVTNLSKVFRTEEIETTALNKVSFEIMDGEFVAIMGPSGCGKSTLLNILGLLDKPTGGSYILDGYRVETLDDATLTDLRNTRIGFIFQAFNLFPHLTVQENIEVPMVYAGVSKRIRRKIAVENATRVKLAHRLDHKPTQLSGGEMQRVAIARSLVNSPTFLLADEPTGNLDEKTGDEIMELFHELHRQGVTIVMVTHNPTYEFHYDRVVYLRNGQVGKVIDVKNGKTTEYEVKL